MMQNKKYLSETMRETINIVSKQLNEGMMNQRIRELVKQADPGYTGIEDDHMGHVLAGDDAIEKFAILIIEECATAIKNSHGYGSPLAKVVIRDAIRSMKEHMGVIKIKN